MSKDFSAYQGVFTALVTPFRNGKVDYEAFDASVLRQLDAGVTGLLPVGTTGEAATLQDVEAIELVRRTVELAEGRAMVIAGAGSNNTEKTVEKVQQMENAGADALLLVTPYYNKPTQRGLIAHYSVVAEATSLPIMLYSVPGRCGVAISPETCAVLVEKYKNIVAIKEAGGAPERVAQIRKACKNAIAVHSGDDALTLPFLSFGAVGVTSVVSNVAPREMVDMVAAWQSGDIHGALKIHEQLMELMDVMFVESNPGPVKAALAMLGLMTPDMRLPMVPVSQENLLKIRAVVDGFSRPLVKRSA